MVAIFEIFIGLRDLLREGLSGSHGIGIHYHSGGRLGQRLNFYPC